MYQQKIIYLYSMNTSVSGKTISIVIPVFNEELNIISLYEAIAITLKNLEAKAEFIFVNDGSTDSSLSILRNLAKKENTVKVISFTRNFGHQAALTAGLDIACGDAIVTMDCDFQDPPEVISEMVKKWLEGSKIIYGRRSFRKDGFFKRFTAKTYYKLLFKASDIKIMGNIGDFRLIDKSVVYELRQMKEKSRYLRGMVPWLGFSYAVVDYIRPLRKKGKTGFSLLKMSRFAMTGILNFSLFPLRLGLILGIFIISTGIIFLFYLAIRYFFDHQFYKLLEWLAVVNYILIGFLFILIWIVAEYIGRIYDEVKGRPLYVIETKINISEG
jgi:polyisoprenyl-phosphate glycosyltransferase